ncbi:hypothetical protein [Caldithrix abyssi]|uniref:Terminase-like family protein n=1 Tax=Caldithrix abyssi DSM 13497 TaxID=880073 RepID=A0A1J1CEK2_CALAY|nr:hypothetical protein [Caldithrix abyssi]APF20328.1 hypothetical protein Cabys_3582 [Caldithrix abyssi DSM 13497]
MGESGSGKYEGLKMEQFSLTKIFIEQLKAEALTQKQYLPVPAFSAKERKPKKVSARIERSKKDFFFFDKTYFPKEMYFDGYAPPNKMHKEMVKAVKKPGVHIFFGPRKHGKTVTEKKLLIWLLLNGIYDIAGIYSETLPKASNFLKDIILIITQNDRLLHDYQPEFTEANADQFTLKVRSKHVPGGLKFCAAFSEGRSVRGYTRMFGRPQILFGDDIETLESSFAEQAVDMRINKLTEAYHSCAENAVFIISANDFLTQCALHRIRLEYEEGLLSKDWHVNIFKAWDNKPLWPQRYPAKSESELKALLKPKSEADWQANFQQNPIPPEGFFFKSEHYKEYDRLPDDARGVIYCDPNLAKKAKGDTTAIVGLAYSPKKDQYFVVDAICKSFADSNELLNTVLQMKTDYSQRILGIAFDGNVTQESTWSNFIKNWCRIHKMPFPLIEFKRYHVDDLAKNCQIAFTEGRILFPKNFAKSKNGERFLGQLFGFSGKKANKADDAPDALICAFEYIHERRIVRYTKPMVKTVKDYYTPF